MASENLNPYSIEAMTARLEEQRTIEADLRSQLEPLQAELNGLGEVPHTAADEVSLRSQIAALNDQLYPVMQEIVTLRRALPGHRSPGGPDAD